MDADMGGQFDKILTLGLTDAFVASGPFPWASCYLMSVFIFQSDAEGDAGAASALGVPTLVQDPNNAAKSVWQLEVKKVPPPDATRALKEGPALASAVAFLRSDQGISIEQWGQYIQLTGPPGGN
jgi:hypothetical protein